MMTTYTAWSNTNEMGGSPDAYAYNVDGMSMVRTKSQQNSYHSASNIHIRCEFKARGLLHRTIWDLLVFCQSGSNCRLHSWSLRFGVHAMKCISMFR